ncbi:alpha/beta hydrolase [Paraburkholderia sp. EG286B]|uniref:alpha/beta hydrolase n=1 Tax=Paraburkholderia sp. EG286B TaxID=3237011 RepID=UPI0034D16E72
MSKLLCCSMMLAGLITAGPASAQSAGSGGVPDVPPTSAASPDPGAQPVSHPKTVVFIHGMFMTPRAWDKWQAYFQQQGYTTIAPAWPLHVGPIRQQWTPEAQAELGKLTLDQVIESYREVLRQLPEKPIVIGHSMGGLVAQKLLSEGLAAKAVAIDSAPPSGLIVFRGSFIKSNWAVINPLADINQPVAPSFGDFQYAFSNCLPQDEAQALYQEHVVPESRRVGRGTSSEVAKIDFSKPHGPLLIIAGEDDHIIPAALNLKNFKKYSDPSSVTDFHQFPGQCHGLTVDKNWQDVAGYVKDWLGAH